MPLSEQSRAVLDEAYGRLHLTGPELEGFDTNHGFMAVESLVRNGRADAVEHWVDRYLDKVDEVPRGLNPVTAENWREALGDVKRLGDWPVYFRRELAERAWTEVLADWWPRLVPGIVAGATHGVIRVGHAVRTLGVDGPNDVHLEELVQSLAYWAARWQQVPGFAEPAGERTAAEALAAVPRVPERSPGIRERLAQLPGLPGWGSALTSLKPVEDAEGTLREVVTAAVGRYRTHGHGSPIMMVHAATAPNAVLRVLPHLPREQWAGSAAYGWAASAAVVGAYVLGAAEELPEPIGDAAETFAAAVANGDEHVIKFADTALDVHTWHEEPEALAAAARAVAMFTA